MRRATTSKPFLAYEEQLMLKNYKNCQARDFTAKQAQRFESNHHGGDSSSFGDYPSFDDRLNMSYR